MVVHIDYMKAPLVVQRFGDVKRLVEQTLTMQSAHVDGVAGATYTTMGWRTSLQSALSKAGL